MCLKNVRFLPRRPQSEIAAVLSLSDVLLVHLKDAPLFRITIPSKIQAYLAVGRPILIGVRGDAAELVAEAQAGVACPPQDPYGIAEKVCKLQAMSGDQLKAMGESDLRICREEVAND
jgi:glycosyltransferase involved in cell wall biosynthesis